MVAMSSTTGASSPGRHRDRDRVGAEQSLGAAPQPACGWRWRPPNRCRSCRAAAASRRRRRPRRRGCCAARRPRRRRSPSPARSRCRRRAAITRWPMPLSPSTMAVAGAVCSTVMFGLRIDAAGLDAADVLRQAEHAVRVGAGEIGLRASARRPSRRRRPAAPTAVIASRMNAAMAAAAIRRRCPLIAPLLHARQKLLHHAVEDRHLVELAAATAP